MPTASSAPAFSPTAADILPLKAHLAEDGSFVARSDTSVGSDRDHHSDTVGSDRDQHSDTDEDLFLDCEPAGFIGLPPGLEPRGLELEVEAVAPAKRTPLRTQAAVYAPLRSQAEAFVPKSLKVMGQRPRLGGNSPKAPQWTTVMLRNIPLSYTCDSLIDLLESMGFSPWVDFVYVPVKRTEALGVGYSFVNLTTPERAEEFKLAFEGFDAWPSSSSRTACTTHWSVCQGLRENVRRYRNSPLMSDDVPAFVKPVLLKNGVRIPFAQPTKKVRPRRAYKDLGPECAD